MTNKEWKELALEQEEEIKKAMQEAFRDSIGDIKDSWSYAVVLDDEGDVSTRFLSQNSTCGDVWKGSAIVVASWERDTINELSWELEQYLTPIQLADFELWQADDENYYKTLEDWDENLYEELKEQRHKDFLDEYTADTIANAWDNFFADLNEN